MRMYNPPHPGLLIQEYINGLNSSVSTFAERMGVARVTLSRIVNGRAGISPEMALRLSKLLTNTTPNFWLRMQGDYDLWQAEQTAQIHEIQPIYAPKINQDEQTVER